MIETSDFVIQESDFDPDFFNGMQPVQQRGRRKAVEMQRQYLPLICAFDIETSTLPKIKQAIMYHWQFQLDRFVTITGRTWDEFVDLIAKIIGAVGENTLIVYVHNLSYEFQFISDPEIYDFSSNEVFAMDERSILKCCIGRQIEFRCSYRLFNAGLGHVTKKEFNVKHKKLDGDEYDYNKIRYPWDPMTDQELQYCYNDVRGLVESVYAIMDFYHDSIYTIPLTSTGYPRRDCKKVLYGMHRAVKDMIPDYEIYKMLRKAFRGGDTHASRHWAGVILEDVHSADRSSSYSDVNVNCRYPVSSWHEVITENLTMDYVIDLIGRRGKACLMECEIDDLDLKDPDWPAPYLTIDKSEDIRWPEYEEDKRPCKDNGRILRAKHLKVYITDIDLRIILQTYTGHIEFKRCYFAAYGNLPRRFIEVINGYYRNKTSLKGLPDPDGSIGVMYRQSKAKNNGIYGMEATDPIKPPLVYDGTKIDMPLLTDDVVGELYNDYTKKAWIPYSWGVWTTALARYELFKGMQAIANDTTEDGRPGCWDIIYWDTDSLKYIGDHDEALRKLNLGYIKRSRSNKGFAMDPTGEEHFLGVFEKEKTYKRFLTWGAKKYAFQYSGNPIGKSKIFRKLRRPITINSIYKGRKCQFLSTYVTIAGVNKEIGAKELREKGGLEKLKVGFVFEKAGGTDSYYNDVVPEKYQYLNIDGHVLHITKNLAITPSTYKMKLGKDYPAILEDARFWRARLDDEVIYRYTKRRSVKS